jgi:predicted regulator of Ras-like GTPase activity (Roadblock/LC7/MglB family)
MKLSQIGDKINIINNDLQDFIRETDASNIILCDMGGEILTYIGNNSPLDFPNIAAMAAGSYATTKGIANLLGQKEFSLLFHQGSTNNILISNVENYAIFIIVFGNSSVLGIVKQKSRDLKTKLDVTFKDIVKGKGIIVKKAKIFEEHKNIEEKEEKSVKKKEETRSTKKEEENEKESKKFDFDSLMIDDLDDIF